MEKKIVNRNMIREQGFRKLTKYNYEVWTTVQTMYGAKHTVTKMNNNWIWLNDVLFTISQIAHLEELNWWFLINK